MAPRPPDLPGSPGAWDPEAVDPQYPDVDGVGAQGTTITLPDARTLSLLRTRLEDCELDLPDDTPIDAQDAVLVGVDLTGRRFEGLRRVRLERCRLGGADLGDAPVRDVVLVDCILDLASARQAQLERVVVGPGRIEGLDLTRARLTDVAFVDVELGTVALDGVRCERVDLTRADLSAVADLASLRGCTVSAVQAVGLAERLARAVGLTVARGTDGDAAPA